MSNRIAIMLWLLMLWLFTTSSKSKDYQKTPSKSTPQTKAKAESRVGKKSSVSAFSNAVSLFDSPCAYREDHEDDLRDCVRIQLGRQRHVEVLLPVYNRGTNRTLLVPFLVFPSERFTTLTSSAFAALGVIKPNSTTQLGIVEAFLMVHKGDENILGLDYLLDCLLATDFYASQVGMLINLSGGRSYELNWPLPAFKEHKKHKKARKVFKKHKKLEKAVYKLKHKHLSKLAKLTQIAQEQDQLFHVLQQKYEKLQTAFHASPADLLPPRSKKTRIDNTHTQQQLRHKTSKDGPKQQEQQQQKAEQIDNNSEIYEERQQGSEQKKPNNAKKQHREIQTMPSHTPA